jgi:hypothetical protein
MDLFEYQKAAEPFGSNVDNHNRLLRAACGLAGEGGETVSLLLHPRPVQNVPWTGEPGLMLLKELGDILWYCADACAVCGLQLGDVYARNLGLTRRRLKETDVPHFLFISVGTLVDHIKKVCFQGHELDADYVSRSLCDILHVIEFMASEVIHPTSHERCTVYDVATTNIEKLSARYPSGRFDAARSLNRKSSDT